MSNQPKLDKQKSDRKELARIRRAINDPTHYGKMIDGVHTWDVTKIFQDFRAVIQIARRAQGWQR